MPKTILVPVDLTTDEPPELAFALEIAKAAKADVLLLHVVDYLPTMIPVEVPGGYPMPQIEFVRDAAMKRLERMAAKNEGATIRTGVEIGTASHEIVERAKKEGASQIVMGSHSRNAIARAILGSVANRVVHTAPCPVTIVRTAKS